MLNDLFVPADGWDKRGTKRLEATSKAGYLVGNLALFEDVQDFFVDAAKAAVGHDRYDIAFS